MDVDSLENEGGKGCVIVGYGYAQIRRGEEWMINWTDWFPRLPA